MGPVKIGMSPLRPGMGPEKHGMGPFRPGMNSFWHEMGSSNMNWAVSIVKWALSVLARHFKHTQIFILYRMLFTNFAVLNSYGIKNGPHGIMYGVKYHPFHPSLPLLAAPVLTELCVGDSEMPTAAVEVWSTSGHFSQLTAVSGQSADRLTPSHR